MTVLQAVVLGLVQGLTEFLPISSSAHLVLVPELAGWAEPDLTFIVLLHAATLAALLLYFRKDLFRLLKGFSKPGTERSMLMLLAVGTLPAAAIGYLLEEQFERQFGHPLSVALQLIVTGLILLAAEGMASRIARQRAPATIDEANLSNLEAELSPVKAVAIGFAQAVSIVPGISRSGATIGAGLLAGLTRRQATRFSFLLAIPILLGTSVAKIPDLASSELSAAPLFAGFVASGIAGYAAIAGMVGHLQKRGLTPFAVYCLIAGALAAFFVAQ